MKTKTLGQKKKKLIGGKQKTIFIIACLAIPVIHWLVFWLYVNLQSIMLAFQDMRTGAFDPNFEHFKTVFEKFKNGGELFIAISNTAKYFLNSIFVVMPICLVISFFFYKKIAGYKVFRIIFYLPAIISGMVYVTAFTELVHPNGPICEIVRLLGGEVNEIGILARPETATTTILVYCTLTGCTGNVLIFGGGMARIPEEVIEAAKLDGVGPFRELVSIIFPLIWPTISTQLIFAMTGFFNASGPILLFPHANNDVTTISFWIFEQVYGEGGLGGTGFYNVVSAAGLCFTLVGVPVILLTQWLIGKVDKVEY